MVRVDSLTFAYPQHARLFQSFDWQIERGQRWAVLGPSGCGKTSLLYLLAGLLKPTGGEIFIENEPVRRPRPRSGLILQDYGLLPWATIKQNVELGLRVRNFYGPDGRHTPQDYRTGQDVTPWLERLGISDLADKYPTQVSGGQRQRAAIARTLILQPDLLLMDEPYSSLDTVTREDLQSLTLKLCTEQKLTLILVTHSIEEAAAIGNRILLLNMPPNHKPCIFENPNSGSVEYRQSSDYRELCKTLRAESNREKA